jgi:hypothetical protein
MFRRSFALAGVIFACVGAGVFAAVGIEVWVVKAEVNRQAAYLAKNANIAGDAADRAIQFVSDVIGEAKGELKAARKQTADPATVRVNPLVQMSARQASVKLAGSVDRALGAVVAASDAVTVADAALHVLSEKDYPELVELFGVHPEQVKQTRGKLNSVSDELRQAKGVLGGPSGSDVPLLTAEQLDAVDEALRLAEGFRAEMSRIVAEARVRVDAMHHKADLWAWRVAAATTAACVIGIVGQFFMARFFLRKLHRLPA